MSMNWYMLTIIGRDQTGIVAQITATLFRHGANLGEASMIRLGGNFTIMMMLQSSSTQQQIIEALTPLAETLQLSLHIDAIAAELHHHLTPNVSIAVHGADRSGIVARVTGVLAEAGLHILDLQTDVAGTDDKPIYVMMIDGTCADISTIQATVQLLDDEGISVTCSEIDTMIG